MLESWNLPEGRECEFQIDRFIKPLPEDVQEWLAAIFLLDEIPLGYVVPGECLLPMESIRFFRMDKNWMRALADGALSIGRDTSLDMALDRASKQKVLDQALGSLPLGRRNRMHPNHRRFCRIRENFGPGTAVSGFLMRSEMTGHWNGIEVRGSEQGRDCEILRMVVPEDKLLLCLFEGTVDKVQFQEPAEALHFGTKDSSRVIRVRAVKGDVGKSTGQTEIIPADTNGRVDVSGLRKNLARDLGIREGEITSAELALQMLCVADMCEFTKGGA